MLLVRARPTELQTTVQGNKSPVIIIYQDASENNLLSNKECFQTSSAAYAVRTAGDST